MSQTTVSTNSANWDHSSAGYLTNETNTTLSLADDTLTYTSEDDTVTTISLQAYTGGGMSAIVDATDTDISSPEKGEVLIYQSSTNKWTNKTDRASIESMYNYANTNFFSELSYDGTGKLTAVDVWVSSSKSTKLYERTFTYDTSDNLTTIVTKDVQGVQGGSPRHTLTKTLAYDVNNNLTSVTRVYT